MPFVYQIDSIFLVEVGQLLVPFIYIALIYPGDYLIVIGVIFCIHFIVFVMILYCNEFLSCNIDFKIDLIAFYRLAGWKGGDILFY